MSSCDGRSSEVKQEPAGFALVEPVNDGFSRKASKIIVARGEEGEPVLDLVGEGWGVTNLTGGGGAQSGRIGSGLRPPGSCVLGN